jgi:hypothetical protein
LSQAQRESYFENGCLLVERAIPADTVARLAIPGGRAEPRYDQYDARGNWTGCLSAVDAATRRPASAMALPTGEVASDLVVLPAPRRYAVSPMIAEFVAQRARAGGIDLAPPRLPTSGRRLAPASPVDPARARKLTWRRPAKKATRLMTMSRAGPDFA